MKMASCACAWKDGPTCHCCVGVCPCAVFGSLSRTGLCKCMSGSLALPGFWWILHALPFGRHWSSMMKPCENLVVAICSLNMRFSGARSAGLGPPWSPSFTSRAWVESFPKTMPDCISVHFLWAAARDGNGWHRGGQMWTICWNCF